MAARYRSLAFLLTFLGVAAALEGRLNARLGQDQRAQASCQRIAAATFEVGQGAHSALAGHPPLIMATCKSLEPEGCVPQRPAATANTLDAYSRRRLLQLKQSGRFAEFAKEAAAERNRNSQDPGVLLLAAESELSQGKLASAEQTSLQAAALASQTTTAQDQAAKDQQTLVGACVNLWLTSRLRQGLTLSDPRVEALASRFDACDAWPAMLAVRSLLGAEQPYRTRFIAAASPLKMQSTTFWTGLSSHVVQGVEAIANEHRLNLAFIDSGGQYTLLSTAAADAAGVEYSDASSRFVGFGSYRARPALLGKLRLGAVEVRNVPVMVGDSPALGSVHGQASLGVDLLHHLRVRLDYPASAVEVSPACDGAECRLRLNDAWELPLYTFAEACLIEARTSQGTSARVLLDTGDNSGTFVSAAWANSVGLKLRPSSVSLLGRLRHSRGMLPPLDFNGITLQHWQVADKLPDELERLNVVDVLIGRDLLCQYIATIDLHCRKFRLEGPTPPTVEGEDP